MKKVFLFSQDPYKNFGLPSVGRLSKYIEPVHIDNVSAEEIQLVVPGVCTWWDLVCDCDRNFLCKRITVFTTPSCAHVCLR